MEPTNYSPKSNFIILFHPLNTFLTLNFQYVPRSNHIQKFNTLVSEKADLKSSVIILPYIEKEVLEYYSKTNSEILKNFTYFSSGNKEEEKILEQEHQILGLDKYFPIKFMTKEELKLVKEEKKIIFISEEPEDFIDIENNPNIIKIANFMIYDNNEEYLNHQEKTNPLLSFSRSPKLFDLIIECFRQINTVVDDLYSNLNDKKSLKESFDDYFKEAINVIYIFDSFSKAKNYRKREVCKSCSLIKFQPFMHKFFPVEDLSSFYPPINVIVQRCPYYFNKNKKFYLDNIQKVLDEHQEILQLHPIDITLKLFDRNEVYEILSNFINNNKFDNIILKVPKSYKLIFNISAGYEENFDVIKNFISKNNIIYPFLLKPISCEAHCMELILNEEGLKKLFYEDSTYKSFISKYKEFIIQEYIPHGGVMIKNYIINEKSFCFIRPSLPNMTEEMLKKDELKNGNFSFQNEDIYQKRGAMGTLLGTGEGGEEENLKKKLEELYEEVGVISKKFLEWSKISFYGLDFLYDFEQNEMFILEINYFPSYREIGKDLTPSFVSHITKQYKQFKETK